MNFKDTLILAKQNNEWAVKQIMDMYCPLLMKEAIVNGMLDEDLLQELYLTLINCIQKINV